MVLVHHILFWITIRENFWWQAAPVDSLWHRLRLPQNY